MSFLEFDVIKQYFSKITQGNDSSDILLSIGDDAAVVSLPPDKELVVCTDTLNEGIHFPESTSPYDIAYKALAVNLSDIAAMGAQPIWFTLNISLPEIKKQWIERFSQGLADLAGQYRLSLIGGDTTRGPLSITITLAGHINKGQVLTRSNANIGDKVYLSGVTGEAAYALQKILDKKQVGEISEYFLNRLNRPTARVELGMGLVGIANACIDVSDGLLADVNHIAEQSCKGIHLYLDKIPSPEIKNTDDAKRFALTGGDDYELVFCVDTEHHESLVNLMSENDIPITCIGEVVEQKGVRVFDKNNNQLEINKFGYQHFSE